MVDTRGFSGLFKESLHLYKTNFKFLTSIIFLSYFWGVIVNGLWKWFKPYLLPILYARLAYVTISLISWFLTTLGIVAIVIALNNLQKDEKKPLSSVYTEAVKLFFPVSTILIIEYLIILGGSVLFIVPGIIFFIWYLFSVYTAVVHKKRKGEALVLSKLVVKVSPGKVIGYMLLMGIISYTLSLLFYLPILIGVFSAFVPYPVGIILYGGIKSILTVWVTTFTLLLYMEIIEANPRILESI